jgi:hypothetical protein
MPTEYPEVCLAWRALFVETTTLSVLDPDRKGAPDGTVHAVLPDSKLQPLDDTGVVSNPGFCPIDENDMDMMKK